MYRPQNDKGSTPRRRGRRIAAVAIASAAALAAGAVAVDRAAAARAEGRTAEAFQEGMATPERPSVHVRGFPVLTQLAGGSLRHVDLTARDIPARGADRPLPVTRLTVGLDGLRTGGGAQRARARSVEATAFLSYADLSDALGVEISRGDGPGRVDATVALPLAGDVTVGADVSAAAGNSVAFTDVRLAGDEPAPAARALPDRALARPVPLRNIPEGLRLESVTTTDDGLTARFTGTEVTFHPDRSST
ncbi:DUF2993 domain-containing protein [Streptomyces sp. NPDC005811]|uniref:LmeA family phospholipid-binding protein n=1 Tax=Streptomyces sp. NPDC005811 TaxID=3154565 RepID=UPI0033DBD89A